MIKKIHVRAERLHMCINYVIALYLTYYKILNR